MTPKITFWPLVICMLIGLPLLGILTIDGDIQTYLAFPPLTRYVVHAAFDPLVFTLMAAVDVLMFFGVLYLFKTASLRTGTNSRQSGNFPSWGWFGGWLR